MNQLPKKPRKVITFLIWTLWIPIILFCSHFLTSARNGKVFSFLILAIVLLFLLLVVEKLSRYLENTMPKENNYNSRIFKQFLLGFLGPLCSFVILDTVYYEYIHDDVIQHASFIKELFVIAMFLYIINTFYLIIYMHRKFSTPAPPEADKSYHEKVLVYDKGSYIPVNLMEIALIDQKNQINWLITFTEGEHVLELSLKAIQEILCIKQFFKINRNQIVNKNAIHKFKPASFGKLDLTLKIKPIKATVSKDRAKDFRKWFYG